MYKRTCKRAYITVYQKAKHTPQHRTHVDIHAEYVCGMREYRHQLTTGGSGTPPKRAINISNIIDSAWLRTKAMRCAETATSAGIDDRGANAIVFAVLSRWIPQRCRACAVRCACVCINICARKCINMRENGRSGGLALMRTVGLFNILMGSTTTSGHTGLANMNSI